MADNFPFFIKIKGVDQISGMLGGIQSKVQNLGKSMMKLGQNMTLRVSAPLAAFGGIAVREAGKVEQLRIAFGTMLGSVEAGQEVLEKLLTFTAKTPFELKGVAEAARSLLVSGVAAEDLIPTLSTIGDVASGVGARLEDVALPYWQILQLGKAQLVDLKQLSTQGVPILKKLADNYNTTVEVILKAVSKGEISGKMFTDAFKSMTIEGAMFFQASQKQSLSIFGLFSTLKDSTAIALSEFGQEIVDALDVNQLITDLTGVVENLVKWFKKLPGPVKELTIKMGVFVALLGPAITAIGFFAIGLAGIIGLSSSLAGALGGLGPGLALLGSAIGNWAQLIGFLAASNPIIVAVLGGLIIGYRYVGAAISGFLEGLAETFMYVFGDTGVELVGGLLRLIKTLAGSFAALFKAVSGNETLIGIFKALGKIIGAIVGGPLGLFLKTVLGILDIVIKVINGLSRITGLQGLADSALNTGGAPAPVLNRQSVELGAQLQANPSTVEVTFSNLPDGARVDYKGESLKNVNVGRALPQV